MEVFNKDTLHVGDKVVLKTKEELLKDGYRKSPVTETIYFMLEDKRIPIYSDEMHILGGTHRISCIVGNESFEIEDNQHYNIELLYNTIKRIAYEQNTRIQRKDYPNIKAVIIKDEGQKCLVKSDTCDSKEYWKDGTFEVCSEEKQTTGGNFKVRCLDNCNNVTFYTVGKVYDIVDGRITMDNGEKIPHYTYIEDFDFWKNYSSAKWELVTDEPSESTKSKFKLIAIDDYEPGVWLTKGNVYEVVDDVITFDDGYDTSYSELSYLGCRETKTYFKPYTEQTEQFAIQSFTLEQINNAVQSAVDAFWIALGGKVGDDNE